MIITNFEAPWEDVPDAVHCPRSLGLVLSTDMRRIFLLAVLIAACSSPGSAQFFGGGPESLLSVRLFAGFTEGNATYREDLWIPINLEVDNSSTETIEGILVVAPKSDSDIDDYRYEVPIRFAPRQRKLIRLIARFPEMTQDLVVRFGRRARSPVLAAVGVREMDSVERQVVILSEEASRYDWLEKAREERAVVIREVGVVALSRSDLLPEMLQGYDTAAIIVWDGLRLDPPTPEQTSALLEYVELGGTVVLALGDRGDRLNQPGWKQLVGNLPTESLPLSIPNGMAPSTQGNGSSITSKTAHWELPSAAEAVASGSPEIVLAAVGDFSGTPCAFIGETPILYRQKRGGGTVLVSTIPFSDWDRLGPVGREIWSDLVRTRPLQPPTFSKPLADFNSFLKISLLGRLPGPWFIGGFLGLYTILLVPVNYLFFRKRKRLELAWLVLPPLALLFSYLAYNMGALQQRGGVVQRGIVAGFQPYGSSKARCQTMIGVYSPTRRSFEMRPGPSAIPAPLRREEHSYTKEEFRLVYLPDAGTGHYRPFTPHLLVHHWAANNAAFDSVADLGGAIRVDADKTEDGYKVTAHNGTIHNVTRLVFQTHTHAKDLGPISAGHTLEAEIKSNQLQPMAEKKVGNQRWGPGYYGGAQRFQDMQLAVFLQEEGLTRLSRLPQGHEGVKPRYLDDYMPPESEFGGIYALAQIDASCFPVPLDAKLHDEEWVSLILTPVAVRSDVRNLSIDPDSWYIRITDDDSVGNSYMYLLQGNKQVVEDSVLSPGQPLQWHASEGSTLTFLYSAVLTAAGYHPTKLEIEVEKVKSVDPKKEKDLTWEYFNLISGKWTEMDSQVKASVEGVDPYFNPAQGGLKLRCTRGKIEGDQGNNWRGQGIQVKLPKVSMEFERKE